MNIDVPPSRVKQAFSAGASLLLCATATGAVSLAVEWLPFPFVYVAVGGDLLILGSGAIWVYRRLAGALK